MNVVANSQAKLLTLQRLVQAATHLPLGTKPFRLSCVHGDAHVSIRFRSTGNDDALTITGRVARILTDQGYEFTRTDDVTIRFSLSQFPDPE